MVVRHSVSAKRINNFMNLDEVDETPIPLVESK